MHHGCNRCKMAAFGVSEDPVDDEAATFDAVRLVFKGDADGLQALLDKKPNAAKGHDDTFNDATALHVAVGETQPACARALLNAGADANASPRQPVAHSMSLPWRARAVTRSVGVESSA